MYALLGISLAAVITFGVLLGIELYTNWKSQSYYSELASNIETRPRSPGYSRPSAPAATPAPDSGEGEGPDESEEPDEEEFIWLPYVDFNALNERFPGVIGWIKLEGTLIDYPIMQGTNNSFYLGHLPDGTAHRSGSIFLDYRSSPDFSDRNSLIYGHESRTQDMFGALKNYRGQDFYEANPVIYIYTPEGDYELVLFAGYLVDSGVGSEIPPLRFRDDDEFLRHIANTKQRSFFRSDVQVGVDDRIVSLATCAYDYTNARWIIVGKLVEF